MILIICRNFFFAAPATPTSWQPRHPTHSFVVLLVQNWGRHVPKCTPSTTFCCRLTLRTPLRSGTLPPRLENSNVAIANTLVATPAKAGSATAMSLHGAARRAVAYRNRLLTISTGNACGNRSRRTAHAAGAPTTSSPLPTTMVG